MARKVQNATLDSRTARDKLKARAKPFYVALVPGELHLGYRRRRKGRGSQGSWLSRQYLGRDAGGVGRYREQDIGFADDHLDANGTNVFTYNQAYAIAMERRADTEQSGGPLTVAGALADYFSNLKSKGRAARDAPGRIAKHVPATLGATLVRELKAKQLQEWLAGIATPPPNADDETIRRRKSTANRVWTIFRAALNRAFREDEVNSDKAWRLVEPFSNVDAARTDILTVAQARRLINAAEPDFRRMIQAALSTGARYSELTRLKVKDFNVDSSTLAILRSKSAKARDVFLTDEGIKFFEQLTVGRDDNELMLRKADNTAWRSGDQSNLMRAAVKRAKIPKFTFHGTRHTYCSLAIMAGTPLLVIAKNLGHADTKMIERNYGHLTDSHRKEEIQKGVATYGFVLDDTVVALGGSKGRRGK
jgi:integrase